jgi:hypothetical protein
MGRRMMRRRTMRRMMMRDHPGCGHHHEGEATWESPIPPERELAFLEEYQRDLEEALADVADRVKTLKEATAGGVDDDPEA